MLACPDCPMSFPEDAVRSTIESIKQSRHYRFFPAILFFGVVGAAVWYLGAGLLHLGMANNQVESGNLVDQKGAASEPSSGTGAAVPIQSSTAASDDGVVVLTTIPAAALLTEWKLRGNVRDLTTLKPLPACEILFTDIETNQSVQTRTDSAGRYRSIVPPSGAGYSVSVKKSGYALNYLESGDEDVRKMDAARRMRMARDMSTTLMTAPSTVQDVTENPRVTDFYLAPRAEP
jgi:hypothetical protein